MPVVPVLVSIPMRKMLTALALGAAYLPAAVSARPMTATDLATMHRIGSPSVSPDGRWIVYSLSETDLAANKRRNHLWLLDTRTKGAQPVQIAFSAADKSEHDPVFSRDGKWVYYLSNAGGSDQLWRVALPGGTPEKLTSLATDVGGFLLAPTGDRVAIWGDRGLNCADYDCKATDKTDTVPGGSGRTYDQLFVRHWDAWAEPNTRSRIFILPLADGKPTGAGVPVATQLIGDAPSKPFGGGEELSWSPDGKTLFFALREAGRIEALSTNLDIFAVGPDGAPVNLTAANKATDTFPAVSPDGKWLAYAAMKRPGYEADRLGIMLRNLATGETRELAPNWDRSAGSIAWAPNGKSLYVTAGEVLDEPLFRIDVPSGKVTRLTEGGTVGNVKPLADGSVVYTLNSIQAPDDLYRWNGGKSVRLTSVNAEKLKELDPVSVKRFSFAGANGDTVWGQIVKPEGLTGKLPVELLVHGGPQGSFGNGWSYRWNPRLFVSPGYGAVTIDFHGSTGYGQAFTDAINKDWGGKPLEDLKLGLPAAAKADAQLDIDNACALGGSYGGYMMNWIEGNWPDRFKCIVMHDGVFDARAMAYETEELWFDTWEHGGKAYYEAPQEYEKWNPVNFVDKWKTPMLVIHGEQDFRIPYTQGLAAFTALQMRDIPSKLLIFPDENHWVLKPRNSIQWYANVLDWLGRYLRPKGQ